MAVWAWITGCLGVVVTAVGILLTTIPCFSGVWGLQR